MTATLRELELLRFIDATISMTGCAPSFDEIRIRLKLKSKSGVTRWIRALEHNGYIRRLHGRARAIEVLKPSTRTPSENPSVDFIHALNAPIPIALFCIPKDGFHLGLDNVLRKQPYRPLT